MGYFSWNTADTKKSIANIHSGHKNANKIVYLLQPNGEPPIKEEQYDGYGDFGGVDAYVWLAKHNLKPEILKTITDDSYLRQYGIALELGNVDIDINTGKMFDFHWAALFDGVAPFDGNYETIMKEYGKTPNELIEKGIWIKKPYKEVFTGTVFLDKYTPLKFSFEEDAVYEKLPASTRCKYQGFFYH